MGCTGSKRKTQKEYANRMKKEAAGQDYPEAMNRMWTRPITQSSLLRVAKDAARLAGRTDCRIRDGGAAVTAPAATPPPPSNETVEHRLFRVVLEIAQIFGQGEVTAVTSAIQGVTKAKSNPDMALVVGDLIMACGGDSSPTVRVLKCLHQRYVLESFCALQLGGPLEGLHCKDVTGVDGWRVVVERAGPAGGLLVRHLREERLTTVLGPSSSAGVSTEPRLRWELAMEFDSTMDHMMRSYCVVTAVVVPDDSPAPCSGDIAKLHRQLNAGPIRVFDGSLATPHSEMIS